MAPLTTDQRNSLWRSGLALTAVVGLLFLLLLANKPGRKPVKFDAVCRSFVAPVALSLRLHQGAGEVQEATAEGVEATISNMESAGFTVDGSSQSKVAGAGFRLERSVDVNQTPSHLDVSPSGGLGRAEMQVSSGAVISSFGAEDKRPWVKAESPEGANFEVALVSPVSVLKGNRYVVSGGTFEKMPKGMAQDLQVEVKGAIPGAMVKLNSGGPGAAVKVWFRPEMEEIPLFERGGEEGGQATVSSGGAMSHVTVQLQGCVSPDLRIEDKSASGVIADRSTDVKIEAISGTIDEVGIVTAEKNNAPRLHVRGRTVASSMQQDEHELLPTLVGEVMDLSYTERGVALIVMGFVLFLTFKVVDRTLGVLLEYFFPKV